MRKHTHTKKIMNYDLISRTGLRKIICLTSECPFLYENYIVKHIHTCWTGLGFCSIWIWCCCCNCCMQYIVCTNIKQHLHIFRTVWRRFHSVAIVEEGKKPLYLNSWIGYSTCSPKFNLQTVCRENIHYSKSTHMYVRVLN